MLRRVFEAIDDRWPSRPVKFAQVWAEAFFLLLTFVITPFAINQGKDVVQGPLVLVLVAWTGGTASRASSPGSTSRSRPVSSSSGASSGRSLWPLFKLGVAEPLTWLAITTVVFGHRVLSSGGVFRGTRLERRLGAHVEQQQTPQRAGSSA